FFSLVELHFDSLFQPVYGQLSATGSRRTSRTALPDDTLRMSGYDHLFVSPYHPDRYSGIGRGNHRRVTGIGRGIEADPKISQTGADPLANRRGVLSNTAGKDQRVQSIQRRRECADVFSGLIAEHRDRLR